MGISSRNIMLGVEGEKKGPQLEGQVVSLEEISDSSTICPVTLQDETEAQMVSGP